MDKKISALGYGFALLSPNLFERLRKENKIRSKKMLSFFDTNNSFFYEFISKGAFLPLPRIPYDRYELFFDFSEFPSSLQGWEIEDTWDNFNLIIEEDNLWVLNFEELEKWNYKNLNQKQSIEGVYYDFEDNEYMDYRGIKYMLPSGNYNVKIFGLKKINFISDELENYGFLFNLTPIEFPRESPDISEINFNTMFNT